MAGRESGVGTDERGGSDAGEHCESDHKQRTDLLTPRGELAGEEDIDETPDRNEEGSREAGEAPEEETGGGEAWMGDRTELARQRIDDREKRGTNGCAALGTAAANGEASEVVAAAEAWKIACEFHDGAEGFEPGVRIGVIGGRWCRSRVWQRVGPRGMNGGDGNRSVADVEVA